MTDDPTIERMLYDAGAAAARPDPDLAAAIASRDALAEQVEAVRAAVAAPHDFEAGNDCPACRLRSVLEDILEAK